MKPSPSTVNVSTLDYNTLKLNLINYKAGNIKNCYETWASITRDKYILAIVQEGLEIDFLNKPEVNHNPRASFSKFDQVIIDLEIKKLLEKRVVVECSKEPDDFISPIFTWRKKDGAYRMILNLKQLNTHVKYNHFTMELLSDAIKLLKPQVWMAKVDLKDASYSIPVHVNHKKFFKFEWDLKYFKFTGMPDGYCEAMRLFTNIMKVAFSVLTESGHPSVVFVDDSLLQGDTKEECSTKVSETIDLLRRLGFTINTDKSILVLTQILEFLGFLSFLI